MGDHPYREAGRRLKAAIISYRLGKAGVDSTLKQIPDDPGEGWAELAERIDRGMVERLEKLLGPPDSATTIN